MYLAFFLLHDGAALPRRWRGDPARRGRQAQLLERFATMVRATVKGNVLVAIAARRAGRSCVLGAGRARAVLWAVLMAFLSLLPAVGAALIWLRSRSTCWSPADRSGHRPASCGTLVIGLVDNVLRPILVGKDTRMPDYLVLITTLGGLAIFGLHGFVIGPVIAAMFLAAWEIFVEARVLKKD